VLLGELVAGNWHTSARILASPISQSAHSATQPVRDNPASRLTRTARRANTDSARRVAGDQCLSICRVSPNGNDPQGSDQTCPARSTAEAKTVTNKTLETQMRHVMTLGIALAAMFALGTTAGMTATSALALPDISVLVVPPEQYPLDLHFSDNEETPTLRRSLKTPPALCSMEKVLKCYWN
jgi:hypothetical protein